MTAALAGVAEDEAHALLSNAKWMVEKNSMVNGEHLQSNEHGKQIEYLATNLGPASQNAPAKGHSGN